MKSFSKSVKEELLDLVSQARHCQIVEVATILQFGDTLKAGKSGGIELVISAEQQQNIRKYFTLFKKTYNIIPDMIECDQGYRLLISNQNDIEDILKSIKMMIVKVQIVIVTATTPPPTLNFNEFYHSQILCS